MKRGIGKRNLVLISFSLVLVLSLSMVSAGWFSDFFGVTGKATSDVQYLQSSDVTACDADFDGDGVVTNADYSLFVSSFDQATTSENERYDLNGDGVIDYDDYFLFAGVYGKECVGASSGGEGGGSGSSDSCTDSDGGKNYYVKGTTSYFYNGSLNNFTDGCSVRVVVNGNPQYNLVESCSGDNCYVDESYCSTSSSLERVSSQCSSGCSDGACNVTSGSSSGGGGSGFSHIIKSDLDGGRFLTDSTEKGVSCNERVTYRSDETCNFYNGMYSYANNTVAGSVEVLVVEYDTTINNGDFLEEIGRDAVLNEDYFFVDGDSSVADGLGWYVFSGKDNILVWTSDNIVVYVIIEATHPDFDINSIISLFTEYMRKYPSDLIPSTETEPPQLPDDLPDEFYDKIIAKNIREWEFVDGDFDKNQEEAGHIFDLYSGDYVARSIDSDYPGDYEVSALVFEFRDRRGLNSFVSEIWTQGKGEGLQFIDGEEGYFLVNVGDDGIFFVWTYKNLLVGFTLEEIPNSLEDIYLSLDYEDRLEIFDVFDDIIFEYLDKYPSSDLDPEDFEEVPLVCESGCAFENQCVPIGYRNDVGEYCGLGYEFVAQKQEGGQCLNSFECDSNFCTSGECVSAGLIQRLLNWFRTLGS